MIQAAIVGALVVAIIIAALVLRVRELKLLNTQLGFDLFQAQRHLSASSAATSIAEAQAARGQAVLAAIRAEVAMLNKRIAGEKSLPSGLRDQIQQLQGSVEAGCFAAGSLPPKEKKT